MNDAVKEVKARLNIEDVVGEYVSLRRAGRNFKGLSPFTSEKTPSFMVSPDKQIWHDFSSAKGGDVFTFVMEVEGLDFRGALELLAKKAGIDLSEYQKGDHGRELAQKKAKLIELNRLAASYYQHSLLKNPTAVEYVFNKRGLDKPTVMMFGLGYGPSAGRALVDFLVKKGFKTAEVNEAGLTNRFGGDLFRGRMMVPLSDAGGQTIGFTGRQLKDEPNSPKYLNTPQTLVYDKGRHVFGLFQAKDAIRKAGYAVIVEGNLDVVSSHQADIKEVVATAGTAMTEHHLRALMRLAPRMKLAFDHDAAGLAATERAIAMANPLGIDLEIVTLPEGAKDPDELVKQDPSLWRQAIEAAKPAVDWVIGQYQARGDLTTAAGKRAFTTAALTITRYLNDAVEREHYERLVANVAGTTLETIQEKQAEQTSTTAPLRSMAQGTKAAVPRLAPTAEAQQDNVLAMALCDPAVRELVTSERAPLFMGTDRQAVAHFLSHQPAGVIDELPPELSGVDTYGKILLLKAETQFAPLDSGDRMFEAARLLRQIETEHKKQTLHDLTARLREAEIGGDEPTAGQLRQKVSVLIKEIAREKR